MTREDWLDGVRCTDWWYNQEYETTTVWYEAPVSMRKKIGLRYSDNMECTDVSLEFNGDDPCIINGKECSVMIGYSIDGCNEDWDYDATDRMPYDVVETLLDMYNKGANKCL